MNKLRIFLSVSLTLLLIFGVFATGAAAVVDTYGEGESLDKSILTGNQVTAVPYSPELKSCANMGNWQKYAENSIEAITDCSTDYISVDVKLTKDGVPVLMADETLDRMCIDADGNTVTGKVSEKTYEEISTYFLRYGNGGELSKKSEYFVPTLEQALEAIDDENTLIIDVSLDDLGKVSGVVENEEKLSKVLFRLTDCDSRDVLSVIEKNERFKNLIIPQYNGNIIFGANSLLKDAVDAGLNIVKVGTKNRNGVVLYDSYTAQFKENSVMAMFSMVDEYSADRADDITGWDNVISHGYSIIETDYPELLEKYFDSTEELKQELKTLVEMCESYLNGDFSADSLKKFTEAYNTAKGYVDSVASQSQISNAFYNLSEAYSELEKSSPDETAGKFTFSVGRIIAAVLCGGGIVASQVYLFKKRKK
ncbi:MAG: glycerophosphodiester phosphodiesterase family protein [Clostridia bacterium]|nr:glycerophosphodiester phosphodiesterase family protein [Clostridia bacterium]